jgi:hypothetical protein
LVDELRLLRAFPAPTPVDAGLHGFPERARKRRRQLLSA